MNELLQQIKNRIPAIYYGRGNVMFIVVFALVLLGFGCLIFRACARDSDSAADAIGKSAVNVETAERNIVRGLELSGRSTDGVERIGESTRIVTGRIDSSQAGIRESIRRNNEIETDLNGAKERIRECIRLNQQCQQVFGAGKN